MKFYFPEFCFYHIVMQSGGKMFAAKCEFFFSSIIVVH